jgi:hypothetical protein
MIAVTLLTIDSLIRSCKLIYQENDSLKFKWRCKIIERMY